MNTKHLMYFLEISKQRNMNKAAETLFVSQSSLSQFLSRLEQEKGTLLFHRQKGNMTLTPAGRIYQDYAEQILRLEEEMNRKIKAISSCPQIRVGVNSIWSNTLVTSITTEFHTRYPDTTIQLFDENHKQLKKYINEGSIDIAVISTDTLDHLTGYKKILRMEEIVFVVSNKNPVMKAHPELSTKLTFPKLIQYFRQESFILNKPNSSFRPLVNELLTAYDFHPKISCEVSNMNTVRNMVNNNTGVSFIPESSIDRSLDVTYFSVEPKLSRINGLICRDTLSFTEQEQYFINLIEQHPLFRQKETEDSSPA